MKQDFKIVPMKHSHVKACETIVAGSDPWKRLNEGIDFRRLLAGNRTNTAAYVCRARGETAGFILFIPDPVFARGGYLRAIGVAPGFRKHGIGRKLLTAAERITAVRASHFFLCVSSFNRSAQAFYRQCGYIRVGRIPGILMPGAAEIIYWKRLKRARK